MPDSFAESADGVILVANGIDPVVRWDGYATQADPAGVEAPDPDTIPVVGGSGSGGITGSYVVFVRFLNKDGQPGNLSSPSAQVTLTGNAQVDYANLPVPSAGGVVRRQVLRNTAGQMDTFYVDVDTTDLYATALTGTLTDAQLAAGEAVPLLDADGFPFANRYGRPPDTKPFLAYHLGRMWLAGEAVYAEGSCQVARGSTTVTGVATQWAENWPGRFLYVTGASKGYEIDSVDPVAQTITLVEPYADPTSLFATYAVKPAPGEAVTLYFSAAGLPEAWSPVDGLALPEDGDVLTAMFQFDSFLYLFKRRKTYRMTAQSDPRKDGFVFYALGRGCVNHRCVVEVQEKLYVMDEGGVYRTDGGGGAEQLSTPIQNLFRRDEPGGINWAGARYFHCSYDPAGEAIRWFVTMNGEYLPRHAIALHYPSGKWWLEVYPTPIGANSLGRAGRTTGNWSDDGPQVFYGGPAGEVYAAGGDLDAAPASGPTTRGAATAAGLDSLTDTRAAFDTSWVNVPVAIVSGRGAGQLRLVVSATATVLRVDQPWAVAPDTTSVYQVGGIRYGYTGGRLRYAPGEEQQGCSVELQFAPVEAGVANLRFLQDFSVLPRKLGRPVGPGQVPGVRGAKGGSEYVVDLTRPWGHYWQRLDHHREGSVNGPRLVKVQLAGVSGPEPHRFGQMVLNGMVT